MMTIRFSLSRRIAGGLILTGVALSPFAFAADTDAAGIYQNHCVLCHGTNGAGTASGRSLKVKDLRSPAVQSRSDDDLAQTISKGEGNMPAFGSKLSPDVINALVAYIRTLGTPKK
jgi:mono/diheme cytochrome c family protein